MERWAIGIALSWDTPAYGRSTQGLRDRLCFSRQFIDARK
jgi:hypothetical protein